MENTQRSPADVAGRGEAYASREFAIGVGVPIRVHASTVGLSMPSWYGLGEDISGRGERRTSIL